MKIGLIGRSNVGKSTLFNALVRKRKAITSKLLNTTRDVICHSLKFDDNDKSSVMLYDLPGWETLRSNHFQFKLIEDIGLFLLLVDGRSGITHLDEELYMWLRRRNKNFALVINKIDHQKLLAMRYDFSKFTCEHVFLVSAMHKLNIDQIADYIKQLARTPEEKLPDLTVAIIGKQNVGKSTLLNSLTGHHRSAVSPEPGTTRDSVEHTLEYKSLVIRLIDTAGFFKKKHIKTDIEIAVLSKINEAIEQSDIIIFMIDCSRALSQFEKRLGQMITEAVKPCIICANKQDLLDKKGVMEFKKSIKTSLHFIEYCPIIMISALNRTNLNQLMDQVATLHEKIKKMNLTPGMIETIKGITRLRKPPLIGTKRGLIKQVMFFRPFTLALRVNDAKLFPEPYLRSLINEIRRNGLFEGLPMRISLKE